MSKETLIIASRMKEADRLKERVFELLEKSKLESWDFTGEDLQEAWELVDAILMIDSEMSVGAAYHRAIERVELAEAVMNTRDEMKELGMPL